MAKERSPNYPALGLAAAVDLARRLHQSDGRSVVTPENAAKAWGYKSLSGSPRTAIGGLRQFGLIQAAKGGLQLSELARRIVLSELDSDDYRDAVREAALLPDLFREIRENYPEGSDATITSWLRLNKNFSEPGARLALKAYRDTMEYAKLDAAAESTEVDSKSPPDPKGKMGGAGVSAPNTIQLPISAGEWARLEAPFPLTPAKWDQMLAVLEVMKPALVAEPEKKPKPVELEIH